jgi:hypothetical protein
MNPQLKLHCIRWPRLICIFIWHISFLIEFHWRIQPLKIPKMLQLVLILIIELLLLHLIPLLVIRLLASFIDT